MLRLLMYMQGYQLRAIDKDLGSVEDFYFDDRMWQLRYLVVDTGNWLPGRQVLIAPEALGRLWWDDEHAADKMLPVELTSTEIEQSPGIESDLPFSLQKERELRQFFNWREYWNDSVFIQPAGDSLMGTPGLEGTYPTVPPSTPMSSKLNGNPHLRSADEVQGYYILAEDGEVGHVNDFICEDRSWEIRYVVVDTRNWLPGKKVLISPKWVDTIDWSRHSVKLNMTKERIEHIPDYTPGKTISPEYESCLYEYEGKSRDTE